MIEMEEEDMGIDDRVQEESGTTMEERLSGVAPRHC